ncbi:hypothetical protein [Effusibacillus dendaii]|uniref:Uncharacterized protein n=1 Tax=Effusibacillus dendaii TaxID=2743772 RepID=A0A7I8DD26_9BACL|nr:hypothetical protein [Effusibacillus dendaii]BCJ88005.1 hypothetical protein skT53_29900 [Effusibacillus dendaii]
MKRLLTSVLLLTAVGLAGCAGSQPAANPNLYWTTQKAAQPAQTGSPVQMKVASMLSFMAQLSNANANKAADTKSYGDDVQKLWNDIANDVKAQSPSDYEKINGLITSTIPMALDPKDRAALAKSSDELSKALKELQGKLK